MIIRIVKMEFNPDQVEEFQSIFHATKEKIRSQPGCQHLELLRDLNQPNVFMTYSYWDAEKDLNNYRNSELFGIVWSQTKVLFCAKPMAWSVNREWSDKE